MIRVLCQWGVLILILAIVPVLAPYDPLVVMPEQQLQPPSLIHLFGTDLFGRDVFSRFLYGGQRTFLFALSSTAIAISVIMILRLSTLPFHRFGDGVLGWLNRALLSFPGLVLALGVTSLVGRGDLSILIATGMAQTAPSLALFRSAEREARTSGHIEAAVSLGAGNWHLWRWHVVPTMAPLLLAGIGILFARCLLTNTALSFLGFGGDISAPEWGRMLYEGRQIMRVAPWATLAPGIGITLLVMAASAQLRPE